MDPQDMVEPVPLKAQAHVRRQLSLLPCVELLLEGPDSTFLLLELLLVGGGGGVRWGGEREGGVRWDGRRHEKLYAGVDSRVI